LDKEHPDRKGEQLRRIAPALKAFAKDATKYGGTSCKVGVFIDYTALPQRSRASHSPGCEDDRTVEEKATFSRALKSITIWYGHRMTNVLLVDTDLPVSDYTNMQPYEGRGWCWMEYCASGIVKDGDALLSLRNLTGKERSLGQMIKRGKSRREPPRPPGLFATGLAMSVESGAKKFTNKGDVVTVTAIYEKAFTTEMQKVTMLINERMRWDDATGVIVCEALRWAHMHGGLANLEHLSFAGNQMGERTAKALALLFKEGAMAKLKSLLLNDNRIDNAGMAELASAIQEGALPSCRELYLKGNPGSLVPVARAVAGRGALLMR
jgi:hypothetical protein